MPTLLYSCETWTLYRRHFRRLDQVQQRHLRQLMGIKLSEHVFNFGVLERAEMPSVEEVVISSQLRWTGHTTRMEDERIPKKIFYGELKEGPRKVGAPRLRYKDVFKRHLKRIGEFAGWRTKTQNRLTCRKVVAGTATAKRERNVMNCREKKQRDKSQHPHQLQPPTSAMSASGRARLRLGCLHTCDTGTHTSPRHHRYRRNADDDDDNWRSAY